VPSGIVAGGCEQRRKLKSGLGVQSEPMSEAVELMMPEEAGQSSMQGSRTGTGSADAVLTPRQLTLKI
jgi:hypothetical protein